VGVSDYHRAHRRRLTPAPVFGLMMPWLVIWAETTDGGVPHRTWTLEMPRRIGISPCPLGDATFTNVHQEPTSRAGVESSKVNHGPDVVCPRMRINAGFSLRPSVSGNWGKMGWCSRWRRVVFPIIVGRQSPSEIEISQCWRSINGAWTTERRRRMSFDIRCLESE